MQICLIRRISFNIYFQDQLKLITGANRDLVAIGDRYFRLGRSIFAKMIDLLDECAVVVVVLSKNCCASEYCRLEIEQARLMRKPIVVFMKELVNENEMSAVIKETFKHFTRATFRVVEDDFRLQQDWSYICQCILQLL